MGDLVAAVQIPRIAVIDRAGKSLGEFPVRRIYCVGRNFADHAREMGAAAPASQADRGQPVFFCKPADAIVVDGVVPYPPGTHDLHHEVELVVALGHDAPPGALHPESALKLVFGYGIGLDLTRRDLQAAAKAKGLPWDTGKAFDHSAPVSALLPAAGITDLAGLSLTLEVNGERRQHGELRDLVWDVADILHELSKLYGLRAGDLVFMGTPAGVGPLVPGDRYRASLGNLLHLDGHIAPSAV
jgi:2-keto-4-pentenoate hydratase/2-oxohepta-3-ene-1,7-dioic acid hydratase in catechol pathway